MDSGCMAASKGERDGRGEERSCGLSVIVMCEKWRERVSVCVLVLVLARVVSVSGCSADGFVN